MVRETSYFVQAFNAGKGGNLKADAPIACKSATGALRTAERLALSKLGVVAFAPVSLLLFHGTLLWDAGVALN